MFQFGERHPVLFEIVLVIAAFLAAGVFFAGGCDFQCAPRAEFLGRQGSDRRGADCDL